MSEHSSAWRAFFFEQADTPRAKRSRKGHTRRPVRSSIEEDIMSETIDRLLNEEHDRQVKVFLWSLSVRLGGYQPPKS